MIIADTGFFVALASHDDQHHAAAKDVAATLTTQLITTWPVITETSHLLLNRVGHAALMTFVESAQAGAFRIFELRAGHWPRVVKLMRQYADLPVDLADASLVVLAEEQNDGRILSTDARDFKTYRWKSRKPFTNLLKTP